MRSPLWVIEHAEEFWAAARKAEPSPRHLREAIFWAVPLSVVELPGLRLGDALRWLSRQGIAAPQVGAPDRPLRGFLFADLGIGFAFLDRDDDPAERVFTLAHELAHFLRDYWQPRREAERCLGPEVLEVFDGRRSARPEERLHALLRRMPLGSHMHLLARDPDPIVSRVELEADRLACELLAPAELVLADGISDREALVRRLRDDYGLPPTPAERYAGWLLPGYDRGGFWKERLAHGFSVAEGSSHGNYPGRQDE